MLLEVIDILKRCFFSRGEYFCPLCRQLANSVLPLAPQLGDCAQMVRSNPSSMSQILDELRDFLEENDQKPVSHNFNIMASFNSECFTE